MRPSCSRDTLTPRSLSEVRMRFSMCLWRRAGSAWTPESEERTMSASPLVST